MLDFIISNYIIFIIIAVVLFLGLLGYIFDKKNYEKYRKELINESTAMDSLNSVANVSNVAQIQSATDVEQLDYQTITEDVV